MKNDFRVVVQEEFSPYSTSQSIVLHYDNLLDAEKAAEIICKGKNSYQSVLILKTKPVIREEEVVHKKYK